MHIISDGFWCFFKYGNQIQDIQFGVEEGIVTTEQVAEKQWQKVGGTGGMTKSGLKPDTDYTICTKGMPSDNRVYKKVNIETIHTPSDINQPIATIEDVEQREDGKWDFKTIMNQYAKSYYLIVYGSNNKNKTYYAHLLHNAIEKNTASSYTQNKSFYIDDGNKIILTWAVGDDGKLSDVVDAYKIYASESASAPIWQQNRRLEYIGTMNTTNVACELPTSIILAK